MKYFERNRRRLTKQHYMRGTQKSMSGTSSVKIEDSAGVPIKSIEITGNTVQYINLEQMDSYLDYFKNTNNYSSAGSSYTYRIALPSEWQGKELTFTLGEISKMTGITVKLSDGDNALLSSSQILLSSSGEISSVTSKAYKYLIFTGVIGTPYEVDGIGYTELTEIIEFWNNYQMTVTGTMTAFPQPILNANDNGMSVVLHGKNLATAKQICKGFGLYREENKDGRNCIYYTYNISKQNVIEGGFKENTQYTISFDWITGKDIYGSTSIFTPLLRILYTDGTATTLNNNSISNVWKNTTFTTTQGKTVSSIGTLSITNVQIWIDVDTFIIQEGATTDPVYEPYFRETIEIPTSIDVDGTNVPLLFSEYDNLTIDRVKNEIIYLQGGVLKSFNGTENWQPNTFAISQTGKQYYMLYGAMPKIPTSNALCSHFIRKAWLFTSNNSFYLEGGANNIVFRTDGVQTRDEFKAFLQEQYTNGTPVTVIAGIKTPTKYDITNTDLGQALISLCVPKGASGTLEITSNLEPTSLDVVYYSEIEEDKVELAVCYVNEAGEDIAEPKAYQVRRGSKYQMVVPHIDGYTRTQESVFGVASNNDVINLTYKEDNDATI